MNLIEKVKRWWAPAEYDGEGPPSEGDGHPLSLQERDEDRELADSWPSPGDAHDR